MNSGEQTRIGWFFDRHPRLLRGLALLALIWGVGYLTWRVGWSGQGASPVAFGMLLATEVYGLGAVGRRRQRRLVYRFEGDAAANRYSPEGLTPARLVDASASEVGMVAEAPMTVGARPAVLLELEDAEGASHEVAAQVEVRSCREVGRSFLVGATILEIDPDARLRLMEWCYVVCSHERLRGHGRPRRFRRPRRSSSLWTTTARACPCRSGRASRPCGEPGRCLPMRAARLSGAPRRGVRVA